MAFYEYLMGMMENGDGSFDPREGDLGIALHDLATSENYKGLDEFSDSLSKFYFKTNGNQFEDYYDASATVQNYIDYLAAKTDETLGLKDSNGGLGYIQEFCRESIKHNSHVM